MCGCVGWVHWVGAVGGCVVWVRSVDVWVHNSVGASVGACVGALLRRRPNMPKKQLQPEAAGASGSDCSAKRRPARAVATGTRSCLFVGKGA